VTFPEGSPDQPTDQRTDSHVSGSPDDAPAEPVPPSCRATIEAFFEAGWPTPGVPLFLAGGYVTKERQMSLAFEFADYIDRATGHPDARPLEQADDPSS